MDYHLIFIALSSGGRLLVSAVGVYTECDCIATNCVFLKQLPNTVLQL